MDTWWEDLTDAMDANQIVESILKNIGALDEDKAELEADKRLQQGFTSCCIQYFRGELIMKKGVKIAIIVSVLICILAAGLLITNYRDSKQVSVNVPKSPMKPIEEWTFEEWQQHIRAWEADRPAREKRIWEEIKAKSDKETAAFRKINAQRMKHIADFDKNLEKHLEEFGKLSAEEKLDAMEDHLNSLPPEVQRRVREEIAKADLMSIDELRAQHQQYEAKVKRMDERFNNFIERVRNKATARLYEEEAKGAILIYDENGKPIGFEKDDAGNPIYIPKDEDKRESDTSQDITPPQQEAVPIAPQQTTSPVQKEPSLLASQVTDLWLKTYEEYPETVFVPMLSQEEFDKYFPDDASKAWLQSRQKRMQNEVVSTVRKMLSSKASQEEISIVKESIARFWDRDFADSVIKQLQRDEK